MRWIKKIPVAPHLLGVSSWNSDDLLKLDKECLEKFQTQKSSPENSKHLTINETGEKTRSGNIMFLKTAKKSFRNQIRIHSMTVLCLLIVKLS